jgi:hypothetical protein
MHSPVPSMATTTHAAHELRARLRVHAHQQLLLERGAAAVRGGAQDADHQIEGRQGFGGGAAGGRHDVGH